MRTATAPRRHDRQDTIGDDESAGRGSDGRGLDDKVADQVHETVRDQPWLVGVTRLGWLGKGVVYSLMGIAAVTIARSGPIAPSADEEASPQGAVDTIHGTPGGRVLLAVFCVSLLLYVAWRVLSIAVQRGNDARHWINRIGYTFSALFYLSLAWVAGRAALRGDDPGHSTQVESASRRVLEMSAGRWLLGVAGAVVIVVGAVFVVERGVMRRFRRDLDLASAKPGERELIVGTGVIGWIGRGVVTMLVGWFVLRAALHYDPNEAKGFDLALRETADTTRGSWFVLAAGVGLLAYGAWCVISARRQALRS